MSTSIVSLSQFATAVMSATILLMVALTRTYNVWVNRPYRNSRIMIEAGLALMVIHFGLQFVTEWRLTNNALAVALNIAFLPAVGLLFLWSVYNLLCAGRNVWKGGAMGAGVYVLLLLLLAVGFTWQGGKYLTTIEAVCMVIEFFVVAYFSFSISRQYRRVSTSLANYYDYPAENLIRWTRWSALAMSLSFLVVPTFCIITNNTVLFFLIWAVIIYYITSFLGFGFNARKVLVPASDAAAAPVEVSTEEKADEFPGCGCDSFVCQKLRKWTDTRAYLRTGMTMQMVAEQTGMRRAEITEYLNSVLGKTFRQWLNDMRLDEAKKLLAETNDTVESIADDCGLSRTYFQKMFREQTGMTPSEWREHSSKDKG